MNMNNTMAILLVASAVMLVEGLAIVPTTMQSASANHGERDGLGGGIGEHGGGSGFGSGFGHCGGGFPPLHSSGGGFPPLHSSGGGGGGGDGSCS